MKLQRIILFCICSLFFSFAQANPIFHDTKGRSIDIAELKNKWIIINYWATWCDACLHEIPELNRFYRHSAAKNVVIYGVNYDHLTSNELLQASNDSGIHFPVLVDDPSLIWKIGATDVLPVTYIINPKGSIVKKFIGPTTEQALSEALDTLQQDA